MSVDPQLAKANAEIRQLVEKNALLEQKLLFIAANEKQVKDLFLKLISTVDNLKEETDYVLNWLKEISTKDIKTEKDIVDVTAKLKRVKGTAISSIRAAKSSYDAAKPILVFNAYEQKKVVELLLEIDEELNK